ncbi:hypothetical protein BD309DRAFT_995265 [Dichomitus squalens]|uniref:Uncharacterized protein n=1 Tax=Dichomitus squalens (strain LYAD-421) TaxID=732165 RepID=R7T025_DICSQ|nr:uncharacterized protein DICSQDRAFT_170076 [Dichomitus squalens LYAD-421 SS1]EJF61661.1 hypothetical protein DICSQDRAFT_170076 [Dichomitus squalens LYAD-421 SS1]TBU37137.1 hypothetical protein BD309DRAFT_995265 [Dichomitus squalens]
MDAIHFIRRLAANGPPYPGDTPRPVMDFLTSIEADGNTSEDARTDYSSRYFLEAFELFPRHPPTADAPARTKLTYTLLRLALFCAREAYLLDGMDSGRADTLDYTTAGPLYLELDDNFGDVLSSLFDASPLGKLLDEICPSSDDDPSPSVRPACDPPPVRPACDSLHFDSHAHKEVCREVLEDRAGHRRLVLPIETPPTLPAMLPIRLRIAIGSSHRFCS